MLRDYQQLAVDNALGWASTGQRRKLYAAPTGVGKSFIELEIQSHLSDWWIITPRLEIIRSILEKKNIFPNNFKELVDACWEHKICTPIRFRNALFRGDIPQIKGLIFDEGHHAISQSWTDIYTAAGFCPTMLFTATPFRGTPRATARFKEEWGEPTWIITIREAHAKGDICIPTIDILPLVDDDAIRLNSSGEFDVSSVESETEDRLSHMAKIAVERYFSNTWDRSTVFCMPTVSLGKRMIRELQLLKAPSAIVTAGTSYNDRVLIFEALKRKLLALVQISVVGEGIDLPIRRLIDLAPCMSPVRWLQQFGRATRPVKNEPPSEYICTNRNLLRHSYLLEGLCPPSKIAQAIKEFGSAGARTSIRVMGLETLGRFRPITIELLDGTMVQLYLIVSLGNQRTNEFACLIHPLLLDPIWAQKTHTVTNGEKSWGRWQRCEVPDKLEGFVSQQTNMPSPKQEAWWKKSASSYGLKPDIRLNRKIFAILPLLRDLGVRFNVVNNTRNHREISSKGQINQGV